MLNATARFFDDFIGQAKYPATASGVGAPWATTISGTNATPTVAGVTNTACGKVELALDNTNTAETARIDFGDVCCFKVDDLQTATFRLAPQANIAANQTLTFGLCSAGNTNPDNTTINVQFKLDGNTTVLVELDDNTTNDDDNATEITLTTTMKEFMIDFRHGLSDIRFYGTNAAGKIQRLIPGTTFTLAGATGTYVQPSIMLAKASGTGTPIVDVDYVEILYKRS